MRHHLVIDEVVLGGELDNAVEHHHAPELGVVEDDQALVLGVAIEEDTVRFQADTETAVQRLFDRIAGEQSRLDVLVNNAWGGYEQMVEDGRGRTSAL